LSPLENGLEQLEVMIFEVVALKMEAAGSAESLAVIFSKNIISLFVNLSLLNASLVRNCTKCLSEKT
jgi:hypothetical protein